MSTTTPTTYPPLPAFAPRLPGEHAEGYGLRALAFVCAHDVTATVPTEALQLADHVFGLAVSGRDLVPQAAVRLATVHSLITATLRGRAILDQVAAQVAPVSSGRAGADEPQGGAQVARPTPPTLPTPPAQGLQVPALVPPPLPVPAPAPVVPQAAPQAPPVTRRPTFTITPRPVVQLTGKAAPAAPQVPAADWGF